MYINHEMRFLDGCKFMASSLDKLSSNLDKEQFTNLNSMYKGDHLELLKRKGVYPYDYVDRLDRLSELQLYLKLQQPCLAKPWRTFKNM